MRHTISILKKLYTKFSHFQVHCSKQVIKIYVSLTKINGTYQETIFKFVVYLEQNMYLKRMLNLRGFMLTC